MEREKQTDRQRDRQINKWEKVSHKISGEKNIMIELEKSKMRYLDRYFYVSKFYDFTYTANFSP